MTRTPVRDAERQGRFRRLAAALVALTGMLAPAPVIGAITPGEAFTVSPSQGVPFTAVVVSGANCTAGSEPFVAGTVVGPPEVGVVAQFSATPDAGGDWSATFTVPPNKPAGPYEIRAMCLTDRNQPGGDAYANQPFTILPGATATMAVSPDRALAGADVTVTVTGTLCRGEDSVADIGIFLRVPVELGEADEFVARAAVTPGIGGDWTAQLVIPAASAPGTYGVGSQCVVSGTQFFIYDPVDVVLSAPDAAPAAPRAAQPRFTG